MKPEAPTWATPPSRSYSALGECSLYAEVLHAAEREQCISAPGLMSEEQGLGQRMRRLHLLQVPTKTTITAIVRTIQEFGWLQELPGARGKFLISDPGREIAQEIRTNPKAFRRRLATLLHQRYIVPGWFVSRLHAINPSGQGEVVLPAPPKSEQTERCDWGDNAWASEYEAIAVAAAEQANRAFPGAFPVPTDRWTMELKATWNYLGTLQPPVHRKSKRHPAGSKKIATFGARERLVHAMRETAINLLFGVRLQPESPPDFITSKLPVPPRAFRVWCPRLEELEFIFYSDYHPAISGRLLVPCAGFRDSAPCPPFERLAEVKDPEHRPLWLHQPPWENIKERFVGVLVDSYRWQCKKVGAMYVSLLNVRDEVCRRLRLSSELFDVLLDRAYRDAITNSLSGSKFLSISLESDITGEQSGAVGLNRRPVYINSVPHSLIAIAAAGVK